MQSLKTVGWARARAARSTRLSLAAAAAAAAAAVVVAGEARAVDYVWDKGAATFNWGDAANWNPDGVPAGGGDNATLSSTTANIFGTIELGGVAREVGTLTINGDTAGAYSLNNGGLTVGTITRGSPDQNNFTASVPVTAPTATNAITVANNNNTSFFNIQGLITATTFTHTSTTGSGRTVLGIASGLTNANNNAVGTWQINSGVLEVRSVGSGVLATNYNSLGTGVVNLNGGTLDVRGDTSITYGNAVNVVANSGLSVNRSGGTAAGQTVTMGPLTIGGQTLGVTGGNAYGIAFPTATFTGPDPTFNPTTGNLILTTIDAGVGSPARSINKTGSGLLIVSAAGTNFAGTTTANVVGGLHLNSPQAIGSSVNYALGTAAGVAHPEVRITGGAANPADTFNVPAGGIIAGDNAFLASLTIGGNLTIAGAPGDDAIIGQTQAGGNMMVGNLPTTPTFLFGIAGNHSPGTVTIGPGTPWIGIAADRSGPGGQSTIRSFQTGEIVTNGDFILQGLGTTVAGGEFRLALGNGTGGGSVKITPGTPTSAFVREGRVQLDDNTPVFNGNLTFDVQNGAIVQLLHNASLGTNAAAADNAKIIARDGSMIDPNAGVQVSGSVTLRQGARLQLNDANNLSSGGAGSYTQEPGAITLLQNATGLSGTGSAGTVAGGTIRIEVDAGVVPSDKVAAGVNYVVSGANRTAATGTAITLNDAGTVALPNGGTTPTGVLTNDASSRNYTSSSTTALSTIAIGPGGGTIAATTGTTLTLTTIANTTNPGGLAINAGTNTLNIGVPGGATVDGLAKAGTVAYAAAYASGQSSGGGGNVNALTAGAVNLLAGTFNFNGGSPQWNVGGGTGNFTVASGTTVNWSSGTLDNANVILEGASRYNANGSGTGANRTAGIASISSASPAAELAIGTGASLSIGSNNLSTTFAGTVLETVVGTNNAGALIKVGTGTLTLTGANTYTAGTQVRGGTLLANNDVATSATGAGPVVVGSSPALQGTAAGDFTGRLGGTGRVAGPVTVNTGGTVAAGASIGTLSFGNDLTSGTLGALPAPTYVFELKPSAAPVPGVDNDLLAVAGAAALGNADVINLVPLANIAGATPTTYRIVTAGSVVGTFDVVQVNGVPTTNTTDPTQPNYVVVVPGPRFIDINVNNLTSTIVPEPTSLGLLGVAATSLLGRRRRRIAR